MINTRSKLLLSSSLDVLCPCPLRCLALSVDILRICCGSVGIHTADPLPTNCTHTFLGPLTLYHKPISTCIRSQHRQLRVLTSAPGRAAYGRVYSAKGVYTLFHRDDLIRDQSPCGEPTIRRPGYNSPRSSSCGNSPQWTASGPGDTLCLAFIVLFRRLLSRFPPDGLTERE